MNDNVTTREPATGSMVIRRLRPRDLPAVVEIDEDSFEAPWCEEEFVRCLGEWNCFGIVAEVDGKVAGFILFKLLPLGWHLIGVAVAADCRRRGIGTHLVQRLINIAAGMCRPLVGLIIRRNNAAGQVFVRSLGFEAADRQHDVRDDCIEFQRRVAGEHDAYAIKPEGGGR